MKLFNFLLALSGVLILSCDDSYINDSQNQPTNLTKSTGDIMWSDSVSSVIFPDTVLEDRNFISARYLDIHEDNCKEPGCVFIGRYSADFRISPGVNEMDDRKYTLRVDFVFPSDCSATAVDAMPLSTGLSNFHNAGSYCLIDLESDWFAMRRLQNAGNKTRIRIQTDKLTGAWPTNYIFYHIDLDVLY